MKRIAYTAADGTVAVVHPAPQNMRPARSKIVQEQVSEFQWTEREEIIPGETEEEFLTRIMAKDVPADAANVAVIEPEELPYRGGLRDAWRQAGEAAPHVDMTLARAIRTDRVRAERDTRLAAEDIAFTRALGANDAAGQAAVEARRQALRDLPAAIQPDLDAITDPAALDAYQPAWP